MKELRLHIRVNEEEKLLFDRLASGARMTVSDYIKYRVFENNPDCIKDGVIYESPSVDKHNYYVMKGLAHALRILMKLTQEQKGVDTFKTFNEECLKEVSTKLSELGYNKVTLSDE
jgi:hypothetical protein